MSAWKLRFECSTVGRAIEMDYEFDVLLLIADSNPLDRNSFTANVMRQPRVKQY
jgi:hypothetical protein